MTTSATETTRLARVLGVIERGGNALPHPATLFAILALIVVLISAIAASFGLTVTHPGTGKTVEAVSLLTIPGLHRMLTEMVRNFTNFAPLGTVLVAMLGIAVAEGSGLIGSLLKLLVLSAPRKLLTFAIVFAGIMSNAASEVGYVLLVPLAGTIFLAVGRHPIVGVAAAFAGVSGGYSANLMLGTVDPLLAGLSQEAARIVNPAYQVSPAANYYFMAASTFIIAMAGTWVTERIVAPRLGEYEGEEVAEQYSGISPEEKRGLWATLAAFLVFTGVILWGTVPASGFLRDPETGDLLHSPFMSGIVALIFVSGALLGIVYGVAAGTVKKNDDVINAMGKAMSTLGVYLVLVFFAAQFVAFFNWTNLGLIFAVKGAELLRASGLGTIPLIVGFVLISAVINLFMGSASAKWAIMAPVFIPMLMFLGYTPEFTQAAYRIGDSVTNVVSPMMSYFALIVAFVQRFDAKAGIGTIIATMLPYSIAFLIVWTIMLVVWILIGIPVGPGADLYLPQTQ
ncbi:MAG: AbgT family transporter [Acidobacteria bacterium]|nr:AbgT family transporter [Acidobacteriota bacterium]MCW5966955.1 AbgT family transporter [Blastocatellales bacterium]